MTVVLWSTLSRSLNRCWSQPTNPGQDRACLQIPLSVRRLRFELASFVIGTRVWVLPYSFAMRAACARELASDTNFV